MSLLKKYFIELMSMSDKQFGNYKYLRGGYRGDSKSITHFMQNQMIWFRLDHPIISKIPYLNWWLFNREVKQRTKRIIGE